MARVRGVVVVQPDRERRQDVRRALGIGLLWRAERRWRSSRPTGCRSPARMLPSWLRTAVGRTRRRGRARPAASSAWPTRPRSRASVHWVFRVTAAAGSADVDSPGWGRLASPRHPSFSGAQPDQRDHRGHQPAERRDHEQRRACRRRTPGRRALMMSGGAASGNTRIVLDVAAPDRVEQQVLAGRRGIGSACTAGVRRRVRCRNTTAPATATPNTPPIWRKVFETPDAVPARLAARRPPARWSPARRRARRRCRSGRAPTRSAEGPRRPRGEQPDAAGHRTPTR